MINSKKFMIISIIILIVSIVLSIGTYAFVYYRSNPILVNLKYDDNLGGYINYENNNPVIGADENILLPGNNYTSGISTEVEFWKKNEAFNMNIYGHIYLEIEEGSSLLLNEPGLRYTLLANNVIVSEGNFKGYSEGDNMPILLNSLLSSSQTIYKVYIWIDEDLLQTTSISNEKLKLVVKCEATSESY